MNLKSVFNFLLVRAFEAAVVILLIIFLPSVPPHANISQPYKITPARPFEGKLALNERLAAVEVWHKGDFVGPEAFAVHKNELYTGLHGGDVVKLTGDHVTPVVKFGRPCKGYYQEKICGRPLGLRFDRKGSLYVADAYYGIFKVDVATGEYEQLIASDEPVVDGKACKLFNSIDIASNGDIYWSCSSTEFDLQNGLYDIFADGTGSLNYYNPNTKKNTVLIKSLVFANGVKLADDESFVLVNDLNRNRILRYHLKGAKKDRHDVFIDGLPGMPDNLNSDGKGGFLVPLVVAVDENHPCVPQMLSQFPLFRRFVARVFGLIEAIFSFVDRVYPNEFAERSVHFIGHFSSTGFMTPKRVSILRVSKEGEILDSLHTVAGNITGIAEAFIYKDTLYLGSFSNDYIGRVKLSEIGWQDLEQKPAKKVPPTTTTTPPPPTTTALPTTKQAPTTTTTTPPPPTTTKKVETKAPPTKPPTQTPPTKPPTTQAPPTKPPTTQAPPTTKQAPPTKQTQPPAENKNKKL